MLPTPPTPEFEPAKPSPLPRNGGVTALSPGSVKQAGVSTPVTVATLWRGFAAPFEREYQRDRARYFAPISRTMVLWSVVLYASFLLLWETLSGERFIPSWVYLLVFGVMAPASLIAAFFIYRQSPNRRIRRRHISVAGLLVNCIVLGALTIFGPTYGVPWSHEWIIINIIYGLFLLGLVVRIALPVSILLVLAVTVGSGWMGFETVTLFKQTFFLFAILSITGVAAIQQERMDRDVWAHKRLLREQATRDPLTGLYNHGYVYEHGGMLFRQARRDRHHLAVLLIDVDNFKRLNDTAGHQAGDQALREIAAILQAQAQRPFDIAGRIGGEEFVLLFYDCEGLSIAELAETVRRKIEQRGIPHPDSRSGVLTVSIGAAATTSFGLGAESFERLLDRADKALYQAKAEGRNCCRLI